MNQTTQIKEMLEDNFGPQDISAVTGMTVERVVEMMREMTLPHWGDPKLYAHIISRKRVGGTWPDRDKLLITRCKVAHDSGSLTMVQKTDGFFIIQYAIPSTKPKLREQWFTKPVENY